MNHLYDNIHQVAYCSLHNYQMIHLLTSCVRSPYDSIVGVLLLYIFFMSPFLFFTRNLSDVLITFIKIINPKPIAPFTIAIVRYNGAGICSSKIRSVLFEFPTATVVTTSVFGSLGSNESSPPTMVNPNPRIDFTRVERIRSPTSLCGLVKKNKPCFIELMFSKLFELVALDFHIVFVYSHDQCSMFHKADHQFFPSHRVVHHQNSLLIVFFETLITLDLTNVIICGFKIVFTFCKCGRLPLKKSYEGIYHKEKKCITVVHWMLKLILHVIHIHASLYARRHEATAEMKR
ncbi:hypothetical protein AGLY_015620 [Aphis glycines]|uniref:Uncharacterized protein n=1 Tax=Aphis glycines TaxID=307491 RepID=A0A6G0T021_APHGL|nr:hypothetical protein AGLY_015620 [Aphis glycines]